MKVHHAPGTRSVRIIWLLEELGLSYDVELHKLGDPEMRSPAYRQVHPMGRVPAIEDGDVTLFESGAIVQYILAKYGAGRLVPAVDAPEFPTYLQWFHYAEGMIMPPVNTLVVETILLPPERKNQVNVDRATKLLGNMLTAVDAHMAERHYLAGEFSGADIMTGHACSVATKRISMDPTTLPNVTAYVERIEARPALVKARKIGA